jgi:hypothetical protein
VSIHALSNELQKPKALFSYAFVLTAYRALLYLAVGIFDCFRRHPWLRR